jgi:hypothetical protein
MRAIGLNLCGYATEMQEHSMKEQNGGVLCLTMLMAVGSSLGLIWGGYARARPVDFVPTVAVVVSTGLV